MPPKRNTKAPAVTATPSTRSSRSQTKAAVAAPAETTTPESTKASSVGKRKRTVTEVVHMSDSDSDAAEAPQVKSKAKATPKKKSTTSPTKKARTAAAAAATIPKTIAASKKKANAPFTPKACEKWFESLEDPDFPGHITYSTIPRWLEELGVSPDGIVFYVIAWTCKAKQTFMISKDEFIRGMNVLDAGSNEALLRKLPVTLKEVSPSHANKTFENFYKFCFNHFKPMDVKNLTMDVAQELFTSLLDPVRYSINWTPPPESDAEEVGETAGPFPHRKAFVEFLGQGSLQVITRDQYEQFIPFNRDVPWNLEGFKEEESTWPTLMDTYIVWRKEKYPLVATEGAETQDQ